MQITLEQLKSIVKNKESILIPFVDSFNEMYAQNVQSSTLNVCNFLAQIFHESMGLVYSKEIASGEAYEGRLDLGNINPGDGIKYKGRSYIQITGRFNYQKLSDYYKQDFINHPELLETPEWALKASKWFWDTNKLNALENDFLQITFKINNGFNGLQDRIHYLKLCFKVFQVSNSETILKDILNKIEQNLKIVPSNYYKKSLRKAVPDLKMLTNLKNLLTLL